MGWFSPDSKPSSTALPETAPVPSTSDPAVPVKSSLQALDPRSVEPKTMRVRTSEALPRPSVLGHSVKFRGELQADEDLTIDGMVRGSILQTHRLHVGRDGTVFGNITARIIVIEGRVKGELRASESIQLNASAQVEGDVYTPSLHLTEGAHYQGSIDMRPKPGVLPTQNARVPQPPRSPSPTLPAPVALLEEPAAKAPSASQPPKTPTPG